MTGRGLRRRRRPPGRADRGGGPRRPDSRLGGDDGARSRRRASLHDLGEHRFKDLAAPERVFQLGDGVFPPLRSLVRTNLPVPATPFLGREEELAEVVELLRRDDVAAPHVDAAPAARVRRRLALQAAAEEAESYPDGLWWVSLAPLRDAQLARLRARAGPAGRRATRSRASGQPCRPAPAACALCCCSTTSSICFRTVAEEIARLRDIVGPKLLVTSRERLQLQGEHVYAVPTLQDEDGSRPLPEPRTSRRLHRGSTSVDRGALLTPRQPAPRARARGCPHGCLLAGAASGAPVAAARSPQSAAGTPILASRRFARPSNGRTTCSTMTSGTPPRALCLRRGLQYEAAEDRLRHRPRHAPVAARQEPPSPLGRDLVPATGCSRRSASSLPRS